MKRIIFGILGALTLSFVFSFKTYYAPSNFKYINQEVGTPTVSLYDSDDAYYIPSFGKSYVGFKESLAFRESQGRYHVVNTLGYMGKYQFGMTTLDLLRIKDATFFLNSSRVQEKAIKAYLSYNKWLLKDEIEKYSGKTINGIVVTESGMLAAAHLAGAGSVKRYLKSNGRKRAIDAYGTRISHYMQEFSHYDLSEIMERKYPKL